LLSYPHRIFAAAELADRRNIIKAKILAAARASRMFSLLLFVDFPGRPHEL
jgi:hypothetical protein